MFGIFSRGFGLITDLKDLNFTTQISTFQGAMFILCVKFSSLFKELRLFRTLEYVVFYALPAQAWQHRIP